MAEKVKLSTMPVIRPDRPLANADWIKKAGSGKGDIMTPDMTLEPLSPYYDAKKAKTAAKLSSRRRFSLKHK